MFEKKTQKTCKIHYVVDAQTGKIVEKEIDSQVNTKYLYSAIKELDERSKGIIYDRWLSDEKLTLHELAEKYGVSAERIRQIEQNAMKKVKQSLTIEQ